MEEINNNEQQAVDAIANSAPVSNDWRSGLSEDLRGDDILKDVGSVEDLAKGYVHAQRRMGGMIRIPTDDAGEEQWNDFYKRVDNIPGIMRVNDTQDIYNQLGRPESYEGYNVESEVINLNENKEYDTFRKLAHEAGLNNDQMKRLVQFEESRMHAQAELMNSQREQATQVLREKWGNDFDNRLRGAKATLEVFKQEYPDAVNDLVNGPAGNNPVVLDLLSKLGSTLQEQGHPSLQTGVTYGTSPQEALDKIDEILGNPSHPYHDRNNPAHLGAVEKVRTLYQQAYPE